MAELCSNCGGSFASPAALISHMKKAHAWGDPNASLTLNPASHTPGVTCALCGRSFSTPAQLAAHALQPHPAPRPFGRPTRTW
jgi:Zinc finger, C2H2 type/C2H2-type zinc finger